MATSSRPRRSRSSAWLRQGSRSPATSASGLINTRELMAQAIGQSTSASTRARTTWCSGSATTDRPRRGSGHVYPAGALAAQIVRRKVMKHKPYGLYRSSAAAARLGAWGYLAQTRSPGLALPRSVEHWIGCALARGCIPRRWAGPRRRRRDCRQRADHQAAGIGDGVRRRSRDPDRCSDPSSRSAVSLAARRAVRAADDHRDRDPAQDRRDRVRSADHDGGGLHRRLRRVRGPDSRPRPGWRAGAYLDAAILAAGTGR